MYCLIAVTELLEIKNEDEKWKFDRKSLYILFNLKYQLFNLFSKNILSFYYWCVKHDKYFFFQAWKLNDVGLILCLYHWNLWLKCRITNVSRILFRRLSWHGVRFIRMFGHCWISNRLPAMPAFVSYSAVPYTL